jgi:spoIIIJ-associated protein|tara:strand:- start:564 stop:1082 length:519 start_codon:yes stop_codon:yes gene_type:complete
MESTEATIENTAPETPKSSAVSKEEVLRLVEDFLKKLTIDVEKIDVVDTDVHQILSVKTADSGILIGNKGENLRSLNHILKKVIEKELGEDSAEFLVDINGYQSRKIREIREKARMLGERARMFKYNVEMMPMNAYERMIVHSAFTDDPDIETESQGEGRFRRVIIKIKSTD